MNERELRQVERLKFFSDAVFGIAITLLVIDLRVPETADIHDNATLVAAVLHLMPHLLSFVVSFFAIGAFWVAHHEALQWLRAVSRRLVWTNLRFLAAIAFLPFPTALMSAHTGVPAAQWFYGASLTLAAVLQFQLWRVAFGADAILDSDTPRDEVRRLRRGIWSVPLLALIGGLLALRWPTLAPLAYMAIPLARRMLRATVRS